MNCAFGPSVLRKDETVLLVSSAKKWLVFDDFQYRGSKNYRVFLYYTLKDTKLKPKQKNKRMKKGKRRTS